MYKFQSTDPVVQSIFDEYLHDSSESMLMSSASVSSTSASLRDEADEDIILVATALLEQDDRESRGLPSLKEERQLRQGAAMAGGVAGLVLGGPVIGMLAAGSMAMGTRSSGMMGTVARASGEAVVDGLTPVVRKTSDMLKRLKLDM